MNESQNTAETKPAEPAPAKGEGKQKPAREKETARETIESIVFAFVLAFLFRTFEAEAFVIPTGSMAPTLFGRHKDIDCEQCGYTFQFGASTEIGREGNIISPDGRIREALCPNCRFSNRSAFEAAPFKGDRILVNKFQYELNDPKRFDVVVFKYPEDSKTNYIKRLVGLPGETVRIHHGNLYRVGENGGEEILRKDDPNKQKLIQIPVYDDNYPPSELLEAGWPERWAAVEQTNNPESEGAVAGWQTVETWNRQEGDRAYQLPNELAGNGNLNWLRYRHFAPTAEDWKAFGNDDGLTPSVRLIGDFCGYNTVTHTLEPAYSDELFWVGDLTVSGVIDVDSVQDSSEIVLELTEGTHWYRCHIELDTGVARLTRIESGLDPNEEIEMAKANTSVSGTGSFTFRFANVDDRLCLWIDDSLVDFGPGASYETSLLDGMLPSQADYTPVGIAFRGAAGTVSDLIVERDIYYRGSDDALEQGSRLLGNVVEWQKAYRNNWKQIDNFEVQIPEDQFFVLGDNSPRSSDGRFWLETNTVPREAFVGKAFFIYWPHGIPIGVDSGMAFTLSYHRKFTRDGQVVTDRSYPLHYFPFYPNFPRMQRIR